MNSCCIMIQSKDLRRECMSIAEAERKKAYNEFYALFCLQAAFPNRYMGLIRKGGNYSPDLQDCQGNIGVEVTTSRRGQFYTSFYDKWYGKPISDIPINEVTRLHKAGYFFGSDNGMVAYLHGPHAFEMIGPDEWSKESTDNCMDSFNTKLRILNGQSYTRFAENELFIYADQHFKDNCMPMIIEIASELQNACKYRFSSLFLFKFCKLYHINLCKHTMETHDLTSASASVHSQAINAAGINDQMIAPRD